MASRYSKTFWRRNLNAFMRYLLHLPNALAKLSAVFFVLAKKLVDRIPLVDGFVGDRFGARLVGADAHEVFHIAISRHPLAHLDSRLDLGWWDDERHRSTEDRKRVVQGK